MAFGAPVTFKLIGVTDMLRDFDNMMEGVQRQARETIRRELDSWLVDAQMLTPVDTGALQESGRVIDEGGIDFEIIFGDVVRKGKFVDYADQVHTFHPTGAGYLERVVDARTPQLETALANDLDGALNRA